MKIKNCKVCPTCNIPFAYPRKILVPTVWIPRGTNKSELVTRVIAYCDKCKEYTLISQNSTKMNVILEDDE
jgi:hypothetical protein